MEKNRIKTLKLVNTITFIIMITVNALANILPINGLDTGRVSDSYPNIFAPSAFTFSIWGVIYLLLVLFVIYQFGVFKDTEGNNNENVKRIGWLFAISSLFNTAWIFSWHYQIIPLSLLLMVGILVSLIMINDKLVNLKMSKKEKIFVRSPFSIYFGWITVATIANVVTMLVSLGWNGFGISNQVWMVIAVIAGLVIGTLVLMKNNDIAYTIVLIWAYFGILMKHVASGEFAGQYPLVIATVIISMVIFALSIVRLLLKKN